MKRLLLAGGGHAHLFVLEAAAKGAYPDTALTVISPDHRQVYSAMVPGFLGGRYSYEEISFDLAALTAAVGGKFIRGRLRRFDAPNRVAVLDDGSALSYDVASVAIGSESRGAGVPGVAAHARLSKPIEQVVRIAAALEELARARGPEPLKIVVAGGGAGGIELALAARARLDQLGAGQAIITLHDTGPEVLSGSAPPAVAAVERVLQEREITVRTGSRIEEVGHDYVRLSGGRVVPADLTIWATGPAAPALLAESGLQTDAAGFLMVDDQLAAIGSHSLFAGGDAATLRSAPRTPKSGVYAVRQGPVLAHNLAVALQSTGTLRRYQPQPHALALLNAGDGRAILSYGTTVLTSRWAMSLKDWIDRRFMHRFQRLAEAGRR
jgi:selenide,water dikinase